MVDQRPTRVWVMRALFSAVILGILLIHLLPLETQAERWIGPDIILAVTFAWGFRRPDYVPAVLVGLLALTADALMQRPPGLYAALLVLGVESLRLRTQANREISFMLEWLIVSGTMVGVFVLYRLAHAVFFMVPTPFGASLLQLIITIAVYPAVVLASLLIFGIRKPAPGEVDALGHRL